MLTWRARATVSVSAGAFFEITEPAPMVAPSARVTGATSDELEPTNTRSPIVVADLFTPS